MKDILVIAHFTQVPGEKGNGRFNYIVEQIDKNKAKVEIITSNFSHRTKKRRSIEKNILNKIDYKLTMIEEPSYQKNVSLKRFYSHYIMGKNLKEYLEKREKPDVIYCSIPSLDIARVVSKYTKKYGIKLIIDIQDLWPEAFKMVVKMPIIKDFLFYPLEKIADEIYSSADEIVSVSKTYLEKALKVNKKSKDGVVAYLGTDLNLINNLLLEEEKGQKYANNEIKLAYIGTLGHSYDIEIVIDSLEILKKKGIENIRFIVMGDGPLRKKFENYANEKNINVEFTGRLEYKDMLKKLNGCQIAVNPIRKGSAGSIINKVGDYAALGLPVLNTQESIEYRELINKYNCGFNIIPEDRNDFANKLEILYSDKNLREDLGKNNRKLAEEKFDRNKTYKDILEKIMKI